LDSQGNSLHRRFAADTSKSASEPSWKWSVQGVSFHISIKERNPFTAKLTGSIASSGYCLCRGVNTTLMSATFGSKDELLAVVIPHTISREEPNVMFEEWLARSDSRSASEG
jgi:hypothetical protein